VHFRHVSAKIWSKNLKQHFDWEDGQSEPNPWLRPCPRPQKTVVDRKNQASYAILPSHAGIMPVTEKP